MKKMILKTKAPVVAVQVEGKAPVCVDGKRLRTWSKGVTIDHFEAIVTGGEWYPVVEQPKGYGCIGPVNMSLDRIPEVRSLRIVGHDGRIKTSCTMRAIERREAVKLLGEWSEKERERLQKKVTLGALGTEQKKAMRRAKFEDDGEGMIPVSCLVKDKRVEKRGIPVAIPEFSELRFALVKWDDGASFSVTELVTGKQCGQGPTGQKAILDAREKASRLSPEKRAAVIAKVKSEMSDLDLAVPLAASLTEGVHAPATL
jgi:hypothetical protein